MTDSRRALTAEFEGVPLGIPPGINEGSFDKLGDSDAVDVRSLLKGGLRLGENEGLVIVDTEGLVVVSSASGLGTDNRFEAFDPPLLLLTLKPIDSPIAKIDIRTIVTPNIVRRRLLKIPFLVKFSDRAEI